MEKGNLNIFEGVFTVPDNFTFAFEDEADEESPDIRNLKNTVNNLHGALHQTQSSLQSALTEISTRQSPINGLSAENRDFTVQNKNLYNRLTAAELEADEHAKGKEELQSRLDAIDKETRKGPHILGRKRLAALGHSQVTATKKAYREEFREKIDKFGTNRELAMHSITLVDKDGEQLIVRAEPPHKYEELNPAEMKRVVRASRWKDLNRISDRVYAAVVPIGSTLPPSSHVKQYELSLNETLPPITKVRPH